MEWMKTICINLTKHVHKSFVVLYKIIVMIGTKSIKRMKTKNIEWNAADELIERVNILRMNEFVPEAQCCGIYRTLRFDGNRLIPFNIPYPDFFTCLSNRFLNWLMLLASMTFAGRLFQLSITLWEKKYFLRFSPFSSLFLNNLYLWPLVKMAVLVALVNNW